MNSVLKTTKYVVENSKHVAISREAISSFCDDFDGRNIENWWQKAPLDISDLETENRLRFLFLFNAISFSYWAEPRWSCQKQTWHEPTWIIKYQGQKYNGAWGLISDLAKSLLNGRFELDCEEWKNMSREKLAGILNEDGIEMPLFDERLRIMRETGKIVIEKYDGKIGNIVNASDGDAKKLLNIILCDFPFFRDSSSYRGKEIFFHKRVQLLVADICSNLDSDFKNMDQLTACADYKIPQVLRRLEILKYLKKLSEKVDQKIMLPHGSEEEIEIRANTIWAIEYIKGELQKRIPRIKSIDINDYLWLLGQTKCPQDKPYHRTRTIAY